MYVDAFCGGQGTVHLEEEDASLLQEGRISTRGSAARAFQLEPPFHHYHFIDRLAASLDELRVNLSRAKPELVDCLSFHEGDVNSLLPNIVRSLNVRRCRAVVFADPFGLQLDWQTVEAVAKIPIIDFWYLVPTGLAINHLVTKDRSKMSDAWANRLDRFLGTQDWRTRWYQPSTQGNLFDPSEVDVKAVGIAEIEADFQIA